MTAADAAQIDWHEFHRLSDERLAELQQTLLPEHADEVLAIEPCTGDEAMTPRVQVEASVAGFAKNSGSSEQCVRAGRWRCLYCAGRGRWR